MFMRARLKNERLIDVLKSAPHSTSHPLSATAQTLTMLHGKTTTITLVCQASRIQNCIQTLYRNASKPLDHL
ncbi:hypothetical protein QR685DRAFT_514886 [Neurospora intermedia]|uniref:Uncharacterized protein n=1 Tax=Neurospora intermedia TaxID=5142 RepID=A0ABR3DJ34_NEUIN